MQYFRRVVARGMADAGRAALTAPSGSTNSVLLLF
jgi:hypothetical protein